MKKKIPYSGEVMFFSTIIVHLLDVVKVSQRRARLLPNSAAAKSTASCGDRTPQLAAMEKTKMVIFNSGEAEEPVPCTRHLCRFEGLEIRTVGLDDIMSVPEGPDRYFGTLLKAGRKQRRKWGCYSRPGIIEHAIFPRKYVWVASLSRPAQEAWICMP